MTLSRMAPSSHGPPAIGSRDDRRRRPWAAAGPSPAVFTNGAWPRTPISPLGVVLSLASRDGPTRSSAHSPHAGHAVAAYPQAVNQQLIDQVKEWVADPAKGPALHDLLHAETTRVIEALRDEQFAAGTPYSTDQHVRRIDAFEELTGDLGRAAGLVAYWGGETDDRLVPGLIGRLANAPDRGSGQIPWLQLYLYPAMLVLYAGGLGAVIGRREELLAGILAASLSREREEWKPNVLVLHPQAVIDHDLATKLPGLERRKTPVSDHLVKALWPWLAELEPHQESFERAFDRYEYLLGLVMFDLRVAEGHDGWAPVGRFSWRGQYGKAIDTAVGQEIVAAGASWPLLRARLFGGNIDRLNESAKGWHEHIGRIRNRQW